MSSYLRRLVCIYLVGGYGREARAERGLFEPRPLDLDSTTRLFYPSVMFPPLVQMWRLYWHLGTAV